MKLYPRRATTERKEWVFRRRGSGETWTEMAPSLLTAQWRRLLLLLAGDVETNPGPDPDYGGYLFSSDLDVLVEELHPISTMWEGLGKALKVSKEHLKGIRHCNDPVVCLRKTLQKWLQDIRGWSRLVDALRLVGEDKLCESLKAKYGLLEKSDLDLVVEELDGVSAKWDTLGRNIGLYEHHLGRIRERHSNYHKLCLREMLRYCLEQEYYNATWRAVVVGLRKSVDSDLADALEAKYCSGLLHKSHLKTVVEELSTVCVKWQNFGKQLGMDNCLENICTNYSHPEDCLRELIKEWLQRESHLKTWSHIVVALKNPDVGESELGDYLRKKHIPVHKEALEKALKKEMMSLCIAQCMTVGAPQSGKSSLMRRLLKEANIPHKSTGVADKPVVSAVTADGSEWTILEWKEEGAQFLQGIEQKPSKEKPKVPSSSNDSSSLPEENKELESLCSSSKEPPSKETGKENAVSMDVDNDSVPYQSSSSNSKTTDVELKGNLEPSSYSDLIDTILDVGSDKWIATKKRLEDQCTIYFTDTGGQLEFQEVLPAIISGPSIFLLVFNLKHAEKGLDKEFPAVYKKSDGTVYEPPPGISNFTVRDLILHILASIQGTSRYEFPKDGENKVIEPKVLLVGTHSDCVTDSSVLNQIEYNVQKLLKDTQYYRKGMLQVPCRKPPNEKFVYMVNNESSKDPVFQEIRKKIRSIIFDESGHSDYKEDIAARWLGFDLMLRWPGKPKILTYQQCLVMAKGCDIEEKDVKQVLKFLHRRFGIIRYFGSEGLDNIVITNPQVIYDAISDLIAEKFCYKNPRLTLEQVQEFQNKGLISLDALRKCIPATQRSQTNDFTLKSLLRILSHLHIVLELEGDDKNPETKYFIPCVLAGTIHDLSTPEENSEPCVADLLVVFGDGHQYCPKGVFSILVITLARRHEEKYWWVLNQEKLGRERVVFHIHVDDPRCTYTVHIQHGLVGSQSVLRIFVEKLRKRSCVQLRPKNLRSVCKEIYDSVQKATKTSLHKLHMSTKFNFGFYSTCGKNHISIIEEFGHQHSHIPNDMTCIDCCRDVYPLSEEHTVWFAEVLQQLDSSSEDCDEAVAPSAKRKRLHTGDAVANAVSTPQKRVICSPSPQGSIDDTHYCDEAVAPSAKQKRLHTGEAIANAVSTPQKRAICTPSPQGSIDNTHYYDEAVAPTAKRQRLHTGEAAANAVSTLPSPHPSIDATHDEKPTSRDLTLIKWRKGSKTHRLRIIDNVCNKWETIGRILYIPEAKLEMWRTQTNHDPHKCCNKVFDYWFQNPPEDYPVTWRGFIELLEDVPFKALAEELKEALLSKV